MRPMPVIVSLGLVLGAVLGGGCTGPTGRPPAARLTITPAYLPEGDDCQTPVTLDGTASSDEIDDPTAKSPLHFRWDLDDHGGCPGAAPGQPRVVQGGLLLSKVQVLLKGDRVTTVTLTVLDRDGRVGTRVGHVGLSVPRDGGQGDAAFAADAASDAWSDGADAGADRPAGD